LHHPSWAFGLATLSGVGFACLGISWRWGQARGVPPTHVALVISVIGTAFFALRTGEGFNAPTLIWVLGLTVGVSQYATIKLIKLALSRGPLSPLWCAVGLGFIVTITYARVFLGEALRPVQCLGVAAGVACVIVASLAQGHGENETGSGTRRFADRATYGLLLLLTLVASSGTAIMVKYLGALTYLPDQSYMDHFGGLFYVLLYAVFGLLIVGETVVTRPGGIPLKWMLAAGIFGSAGSVTGLWAWGAASALPAAITFTVSSVVSIVGAAIVSAAFFGERASAGWFATLVLALVSVVLVNA
jgi:drug/metabolite transporter (DMT)-like permease